MMDRALPLLALAVVLEGVAAASPPPPPPPPPHVLTRCGGAHPWPQMMACMHDAVPKASLEVVASGDHVRALRGVTNFDSPAIYVMVERDAGWLVAGVLEYVEHVEGIDAVMVGNRRVAHVVRGEQSPISVEPLPQPGWMMRRIESFCTGSNDLGNCIEVMTSCDVLVRGQARDTFRGRAKLGNGMIEVVGDRSLAGGCRPAERVPIN